MQPQSTTEPDDSLEKLKADLLAVPEVKAYMDELAYEDVREFLVLAFKFAKKWALLPDRWEGRRLLLEAKIWLVEANQRADKELAARKRPSSTAGGFKR